MFIEARDRDDPSVPPAVYIRQKKNNVWSAWMVPAVGGSNPNFSGIISLNARPILGNTTLDSILIATNNTSLITGNVLNSTYRSFVHTFISAGAGGGIIGPTTVKFEETLATFLVPVAAGTITATTQPSTDSSTKVATTAWTTAKAAELISTTPDFPQTISNSSGGYTLANSDIGKHVFLPSTSITTNVSITNNLTSAQIGTVMMIVNFKSTSITITPDGSVTLHLAGTATTGTRTLASGGLATVMKVVISGPNTEWIIWGNGLT
jgi:hypothetical protein